MAKRLRASEFQRELAQLAGSLRDQIEAEVAGFKPDKAAIESRVKRVRTDFEFFSRTYLPHYIQGPGSQLHAYLYERLPEIVAEAAGQRDAIMGPRGGAKSTIVSLAFVLWCVVTERKRYIILISDVWTQAALLIEAIKAELASNPRLKMDFPKAAGEGRVWREGVIVSAGGVKIEGLGSGQKLRGRRHGPHRPDLVIGDDLQNDEQVRTPEQRHKLRDWVQRVVLNLGPPDGSMDVVLVGTRLHYDDLLSGLLESPLWRTRLFKSIERWPDRMDLWQEWTERLRKSADAAVTFYERRRRQMEKGAKLCWPKVQDLLYLMRLRATAPDAFSAEHQQEPVAGDELFAGAIRYWDTLPSNLTYYGAVDPSLGKAGAGRDPSAILVGGWDTSEGRLYVVEALIAKRSPDRIIDTVIDLQARYHCLVWAVESVQFQEFLRQELIRRSAKRGAPVPARAVTPHSDKQLRIESLQPHVSAGNIRLHRDQGTLIEQLKYFPRAAHDDGPDALQMLFMLASRGAAARQPRILTKPLAGIEGMGPDWEMAYG